MGSKGRYLKKSTKCCWPIGNKEPWVKYTPPTLLSQSKLALTARNRLGQQWRSEDARGDNLSLQHGSIQGDAVMVEASAVGPHLEHHLHHSVPSQARARCLELLGIEDIVRLRRKLHDGHCCWRIIQLLTLCWSDNEWALHISIPRIFAGQNWRNFHPYISQISYVGGGFSRPTLHPAHHISANFQRTKQLFVQQELTSDHACHQKPNPSRETFPLSHLRLYNLTSWHPSSAAESLFKIWIANSCTWFKCGVSMTFIHFPIILQIGNNLSQLKGTGYPSWIFFKGQKLKQYLFPYKFR